MRALETLAEQAHSCAVKPQAFDPIAAPAAKDVQLAGKRLCVLTHNRFYVARLNMWRGLVNLSGFSAIRGIAAT